MQAISSLWGSKGPEGRTVITVEEGKLREAWFVQGVASGLVRGWRYLVARWLDFQPDLGRCVHGGCDDWEDEPENTASHLESLVQYSRGQVQEGTPAWWFPVGEYRNDCKIFQNHIQRQNLNRQQYPSGGGVLSCSADKDGLADGEECAFLYPGFHVALVETYDMIEH